jgi:hypothetical protein
MLIHEALGGLTSSDFVTLKLIGGKYDCVFKLAWPGFFASAF